MAHDEGLYAWRSRLMFDSGNWISPWSEPHHKTPGYYWLVAVFYKLFGISETSVRLPNMIFGILSIILLYEIGKIILNENIAWLAAAILSVEFFWLQYCRLGTPDVPMIFLVLLAIFSLLQAELSGKYKYLWGLIAGACLGLGFLIRSFMIFLPMMALFPYLIWEHRRHQHLTNPTLYVGFILGLIPTCIWLWLSFIDYGSGSYQELLNFVFRLGSQERDKNNILYYFWNIPLKSFPWFFFSIYGLILTIRRPIMHYQLILVGFPLVLFTEITIFSTRLSHYSLCLYPFIALQAAIGLNKLSELSTSKNRNQANLIRNLSYTMGGLALLLCSASVVILIVGNNDIRQYANIGLALGLGLLTLPAFWIGRYHLYLKFLTPRYWVSGWLIAAWLSLAATGFNGLIGDYNPDFKAFIQQQAIAQVLNSSAINFVNVGGKTGVLINFYTPTHGKPVSNISQLPASSYAWIPENEATASSTPHRVLGTVQNYQFIQIL
jgi:4-amino-4-deoxy-L-arabinose transferase-like glycosyltransferase